VSIFWIALKATKVGLTRSCGKRFKEEWYHGINVQETSAWPVLPLWGGLFHEGWANPIVMKDF